MLKAIMFNNPDAFDFSDDNNNMDKITDNCIILCEGTSVKRYLSQQIQDICDGKHEDKGHDYATDEDARLQLTSRYEYLPTAHLVVDDSQKIYITVEAPFILTAKSPDDIWFAAKTHDKKISIYPLRVFEGYRDDWNKGVSCVYRNYINGRYGAYGGYVSVDNETFI